MPFSNLDSAWSNLAQYYNSVNNSGTFAGTVNNPNVTFTTKPQYPRTRYNTFDDGLIRGGAINAGIASARDTARIGNFLKSGKGLLWIAKQVGLQLSNPRLESIAPNIYNTRFYNLGLNTLTQIPVNAFGAHIIRHGALPVGVGRLGGTSANIRGYSYEKAVITKNESTDSKDNRLIQYLGKIAKPDTNNKKAKNGVIELTSYNNGPSSLYGIGKTFVFTTNQLTNYFGSQKPKTNNGAKGFTYEELQSTKQIELTSGSINDLKSALETSILQYTKDIAPNNINSRIGVSNSGNVKSVTRKVDSINVIDIIDNTVFYSTLAADSKTTLNNSGDKVYENKAISEKVKDKVTGKFGEDIIKFRIEFLDNISPNKTNILAFRAYIDDFNDGVQATWNPYRYVGRGDEFYVYEGFRRDISVSFTIFAHSPEEMGPIYKKLNYLISSFAPDYTDTNKMRGNIGYLTVGDYLYRQPGVFTDIKLSGLLDSHWEIGLDDYDFGYQDKDGKIIDKSKAKYQLPKLVKVQLGFKPIHTFLPRLSRSGVNAPFIGRDLTAYPVT